MSGRSIPWRRAAIVAAAVLIGGGVGSAWAAFSATTSNGANNFSAASGDTTAPTISRAVAAKTDGSTPGTIRQGGNYYVYAQVTDDTTISAVTADASAFDTGVSSASLSSTGGPWTVGGQSYNYRSAVLSANTPLNTGSSYSYTITATDSSSNTAGPTSYSVSIQTYANVISSTAGLVSHWRMGDGAIAADELDDSAGVLLSNHTGAMGASWSTYLSEARTGVFSNENRLRKETGNGAAMYYASGVPASANYMVEADVHVKSLLATDAIAVAGRLDTASSTGTYYLARYFVDSGAWQLLRISSGAATTLGSYVQTLTAGSTYRLTLDMNGSTIRVLVDGVQRISVVDSNITAAGRGAVRMGTGSSTAQVTNTAGLHLDDFRITSLTTTASDSNTTNNGTYTNGPRLNQPGALVGDPNRATLFDGTNDYVTVPDVASLDLGDGPLTLEAWVKRNDTATGYHNILNKGASSFQWGFNGSDHRLTQTDIGDIANYSGGGSDTSGWHYWVLTKTGSAVKMYRDGVDVTPTITNRTLVNTATALTIASDRGTGEYLNARIDEVAIYNQVLSLATVQDHHNAGKGTG